MLPGQNIESTIDVWLYFTPDLPLELTLEEVQKKGGGQALDPDYETRCRARGCDPCNPCNPTLSHSTLQPCVLQAAPLTHLRLSSWWGALPSEVQLAIADAQQLETASEKQMFAPTPGQCNVKAHPIDA